MEQSTDHGGGELHKHQQKSNDVGKKYTSITTSAGSMTANSFAPTSSSLMDPFAPQTNHAPLPWSTTYSMPVYPSFGIADSDCHVGGATEMKSPLVGLVSSGNGGGGGSGDDGGGPSSFATIPNTFNFGISNESSNFLPFGSGNLIDRLNNHQSINSDNSNLFSNTLTAATNVQKNNQGHESVRHHQSIQQTSRQDESIGSGRSYSSVLHSQACFSIHTGRISMFDTRQPNNSNLNNDSDPSARSSGHSNLVSSSSPSQYRHPQQASRQANDSSRDNIHQQQQLEQHYLIKPVGHSQKRQHLNQQQHSNDPATTSIGGRLVQRERFNTAPDVASSGNNSRRRTKMPFFAGSNDDQDNQIRLNLYGNSLSLNSGDGSERFSRKVFVGGLPPDIDEEEIKTSFRRFGSLIVDWPHKAESKSYFPPKGYAFLLFHEESSVQALIDTCLQEDDKLYFCVSSPTIKDKPVQIRPWRLSDADFVLDSTLALDPRKTVFVGGVPRPLKASELANIMNNLYGGVCYAGIDTDPELKYPKGAGRVAFSNHQSYIAAISARFVQLHHSEIEKRVEVKPYVLDDQFCDECQGTRCSNKFAPFFCANITCLRYYCDSCWTTVHSQPGREFHKPLVKEGSDRPRNMPFRWN